PGLCPISLHDALPIYERRVLRQLLDRVTAVAQDPGVTVDVGDRRGARGRVDEPRVQGHVAGLGEHRAQRQPRVPLGRLHHVQVQLTAGVAEHGFLVVSSRHRTSLSEIDRAVTRRCLETITLLGHVLVGIESSRPLGRPFIQVHFSLFSPIAGAIAHPPRLLPPLPRAGAHGPRRFTPSHCARAPGRPVPGRPGSAGTTAGPEPRPPLRAPRASRRRPPRHSPPPPRPPRRGRRRRYADRPRRPPRTHPAGVRAPRRWRSAAASSSAARPKPCRPSRPRPTAPGPARTGSIRPGPPARTRPSPRPTPRWPRPPPAPGAARWAASRRTPRRAPRRWTWRRTAGRVGCRRRP